MFAAISVFNRRNMLFLLSAAAYYVLMNVFYINIGEDMCPQNYLPYALPAILALCLAQGAAGRNMFSLGSLPPLFAGLSWCVAFPLLYSWTYDSCWYLSKIRIDFLLGTGIFLLLTSLYALLCSYIRRPKLLAGIFALLDFLCLVVPFIQFIYYAIFQHCLTPPSLMALYLTNFHESINFIQFNIGASNAIAILAALAALNGLLWLGNLRAARQQQHPMTTKSRGILTALSLLLAVYVPFGLLPEASIITNWQDVITHVRQTKLYSTNHDSHFADIQLTSASPLPQECPGTVIMVIGESASRNYMKAYTPDLPYDNTPWLEQCTQDPDFTVFQNVYSCWTQTVPVLEHALTESSQYNDKQFFESVSVMDIAKKAGYETYWFSNQGTYGQDDSAITLVAQTADHAQWTNNSYELSDQYDESLLPLLKNVDPTKNNFIVLHIMGSHIYYNNRYPASFEKWNTDGTVTSEDAYANSTLYTDYVLSQIYQYARENLHLQAMLYYSDHGEDANISHNPDVFKYNMVRIPMFVYLSPDYRQAFPTQARTLKSHAQQFFTNDMIYDTVAGLLQAPSNHYEACQDFSSPDYAFTRDTLTTMMGQRRLRDDPYLSGHTDDDPA